jgi:LuxR family transcriptional regulator, maltose regulon positive regulatory protein
VSPFARTKIQPPRARPVFVERAHAQPRLAAALRSQRLVLLCAPAGFGKTAALAQEVARLPADHAVAWICADAGDDLQRLLECLLAALEPFDPPWRTAPEALIVRAGQAGAAPGADAQRTLAAEVINALDACDVAHGLIVFDDLHRVTDAAAFAFLDLMLDRLTERWTIAVTARTEPPLAGLARLRAGDQVAEFRQLQLQFTRDEARRLTREGGLDEALGDRLFDRTQGWPAGLRIAVAALKDSGNAARERALRASERSMFDFLVSEVLQQLPPALGEFLLRVSVLRDLQVASCAAVADAPDAARMLDEIEQRGLFVDVLDADLDADAEVAAGERSLRLHDLFRDALQDRLRVDRPQLWRECLQRAARREPDPVQAQALWLAAGCETEAAQALLDAAPRLNLGGAAPTVLRLCAAFAPAYAAASAELQHALGLAKQTVWQLNDAERHYASAHALYQARGAAAHCDLLAARRAAVLAALGRLSHAAQLLDTLPSALADVEAQTVAATAHLWLTLERGEYDRIPARFATLLELQLRSTQLEDWQTIPPPRLIACRGTVPLIAQWGANALQVCGDRAAPLRAMALIALGWSALWQGRVAEAGDLLARADADAQWTGVVVIARSHGLALRAVLALAMSDHAAAIKAIEQRVAEQPTGYGGWGLWHALFVAVRVAAGCGERELARAWLSQLLALHTALPEASPARLAPAVGLQGTLAGLEGRDDEAITHWEAALAQGSACDLMSQTAEVRVRLAAAQLRRGSHADAAAALVPLLEADDEGPRGALFATPQLRTLAAVDWRGHLSATAQGRLVRWATALGAVAAGDDSPPVAPLAGAFGAERLTSRELDVLARIAAGDSNKLIARAFDLSLHTVKRHVANILGKLGVDTRGQAAAWYRDHAH